ncbi:MAG: hypothetical protein RI560_11220 [Natronomonas sp.]|nr:hypothetical protein [Natronomonas sp.]
MIDRVLAYQLTTALAVYCCWELASIPIAKVEYDGPARPPLSLYQAFVYNRQRGEKS